MALIVCMPIMLMMPTGYKERLNIVRSSVDSLRVVDRVSVITALTPVTTWDYSTPSEQCRCGKKKNNLNGFHNHLRSMRVL